jgi:hypothetical protein
MSLPSLLLLLSLPLCAQLLAQEYTHNNASLLLLLLLLLLAHWPHLDGALAVLFDGLLVACLLGFFEALGGLLAPLAPLLQLRHLQLRRLALKHVHRLDACSR